MEILAVSGNGGVNWDEANVKNHSGLSFTGMYGLHTSAHISTAEEGVSVSRRA